MGKTWLLRGGAVAVFAALVGAWAVGLAGTGDSSPPPERHTSPVAPDDSPPPVIHDSIVVEKVKSRRTREAAPSQAPSTEPIPGTADGPASNAADPADPSSSAPTPDSPEPSWSPDPSPTAPPPSNTPSQPGDDCTDLPAVVDCALDPVTGQP